MDTAYTTKYVDAYFYGTRKAKTNAVTQGDYGQVLRFRDLELPQTFEVHFAS